MFGALVHAIISVPRRTGGPCVSYCAYAYVYPYAKPGKLSKLFYKVGAYLNMITKTVYQVPAALCFA